MGRTRFVNRMEMLNLSTVAEAYTVRFGFFDSMTVVDGPTTVRGACFRYTNSVYGGNWQAVTKSLGVETSTDTGVAAALGAMRRFTIDSNANGTEVRFFIDDNLVATHTSNIPTAGVGYGINFLKSAGTIASIPARSDYFVVEQIFNVLR